MQLNGGPISECPICRYNFEGLPRNHRCPECGFEYEETMRVWEAKCSRAVTFFPILFIVPYGTAIILRLFHRPSAPFPTLLVFLLAMNLFTGLFIALMLRRFQGFTVIGKDGIFFRRGRKATQFRPWREVQFDHSIWFSDILDHAPGLPRYLPVKLLKSAQREEMREEIILRLRTHNSNAPSSAQDA